MINNKWNVITITMPDNITYIGINDDSYYGDGTIISKHNSQDHAVKTCKNYSKRHNILLFEGYVQKEVMN
jgi:hypothetical protein